MGLTPESMKENCERCGTELEPGQIGRCGDCLEETDGETWTNHYCCPCGEEWEDTWDCQCNDRCPKCNREISPYISDDGSLTAEQIEAALQALKEANQRI